MGWAVNVARVGEMRNEYKILARKYILENLGGTLWNTDSCWVFWTR